MTAHPETLDVVVNGEAQAVPSGSTLIDLLKAEDLDPFASRGVAVAVNDEVVRKKDWKDVILHTGDRVEIVTANQGG